VVNDINFGSAKVIQRVPRRHKVFTHEQERLFCKVTSVSIHSFVEWLDTFSYVLRPAFGRSKIYIIDHNRSWKENQRQKKELLDSPVTNITYGRHKQKGLNLLFPVVQIYCMVVTCLDVCIIYFICCDYDEFFIILYNILYTNIVSCMLMQHDIWLSAIALLLPYPQKYDYIC
jgi:hypothetical protein